MYGSQHASCTLLKNPLFNSEAWKVATEQNSNTEAAGDAHRTRAVCSAADGLNVEHMLMEGRGSLKRCRPSHITGLGHHHLLRPICPFVGLCIFLATTRQACRHEDFQTSIAQGSRNLRTQTSTGAPDSLSQRPSQQNLPSSE